MAAKRQENRHLEHKIWPLFVSDGWRLSVDGEGHE